MVEIIAERIAGVELTVVTAVADKCIERAVFGQVEQYTAQPGQLLAVVVHGGVFDPSVAFDSECCHDASAGLVNYDESSATVDSLAALDAVEVGTARKRRKIERRELARESRLYEDKRTVAAPYR